MINPFKVLARWYWSIKVAFFVLRNPWATWLAIDEKGWFYAFEDYPDLIDGYWIWRGKTKWKLIGQSLILRTGKPACEPLYHDTRQAK